MDCGGGCVVVLVADGVVAATAVVGVRVECRQEGVMGVWWGQQASDG